MTYDSGKGGGWVNEDSSAERKAQRRWMKRWMKRCKVQRTVIDG